MNNCLRATEELSNYCPDVVEKEKIWETVVSGFPRSSLLPRDNSFTEITVKYKHKVKPNYACRAIKTLQTRIEPVGEPYREVCLSPWKGNWRISKNRFDWRNVLLSEKNYFHEKELKENGNMT